MECRKQYSLSALFMLSSISTVILVLSINVQSWSGDLLCGTMIYKQTIRPNSTNYVKYTAEIPTIGKRLSLSKHTNTNNGVNKWVYVRGFMLQIQWTKRSGHTHSKILEWTSCHKAFSAARDHNRENHGNSTIDCGKETLNYK